MRKKIIILTLLALFILPCIANADAVVTAATKARTATMGKGIEQVIGVGDLSSGNTAEVDSRGALSVLEYPKTIAVAQGGTLGAGSALATGATRVYSITFGGDGTAAGDYVEIYDATSATGTPLFDLSLGTAEDTVTVSIPGGAIFSTGVFADGSGIGGQVTITYDQ